MLLPLNLKKTPDFHKKLKKKAYCKGIWAERLAALYLRLKGYTILEKRFKTPFGEVDLVIQKGPTLIAVEVKNRSSLEGALFALTPTQQRRIERALQYYLASRAAPLFLRFDLILLAPWKWPLHLKGAWRAP